MSGLPTLISFYGGDRYYYDCAARLRNDCERLGMPFHIEELPADGLDWAQICRLKIDFYARMHDRFGAVLWVDADTRLLRVPELLRDCRFDLAGFGGRFSYIRDYDPYQTARFWVPSILFVGATPAARGFLQTMSDIEAATTARVTDDWVLQEAWLQHPDPLNVGFLAPTLVTRGAAEITPKTVFLHGDSGNVSHYKGQVVQHPNMGQNKHLRTRILLADAVDAMRSGDRETALQLTSRALHHTPDDRNTVLKHADYLRVNNRPFEAIDLQEHYLERHPADDEVRLNLVRMGLHRRDVILARRHLPAALGASDQKCRDQAQSLAYDLELEERAQQRGLKPSQRPPLWWMKTPFPGNFGDVLSPWIVEQVSGVPPRFSRRDQGMLAIGSIIKFARAGSVVWGSGTPRIGDLLDPHARYLAVRGPITRQQVLESGGHCPPVYGDPGLLLPRFLPRRNKSPRYRLGLIRHVSHDSLDLRVDGVKDISLRGAAPHVVSRVVDEITDCQAVLSTSLHGMIIANAYGIPARWCHLSKDAKALAGDGTKFEDYFRSVALPSQEPLDLSEFSVIHEGLRRHVHASVDLKFDADALITAFACPD